MPEIINLKRKNFATVVAFFGFLILAAASVNDDSSDKRSPQSNQATPADNIPPSEARFCSILNDALVQYSALSEQRKTADRQKNSLRASQIADQMTGVFSKRNEDVFRALQDNRFVIDDWRMSIISISRSKSSADIFACPSWGPSPCIEVSYSPVCSTITTVKMLFSATPAMIDFFASKQKGDRIVVSGIFLKKFGLISLTETPMQTPDSAQNLEQSLTQSGSIEGPEYSAFAIPKSQLSGAGRSQPNSAGTSSTAANNSTRSPQASLRVGPSFDCSAERTKGQPIAQSICGNADVARAELAYVVVYQALRNNASDQEIRALRAGADEFLRLMSENCRIPLSGTIDTATMGNGSSCLVDSFNRQRLLLLNRATPEARIEAEMPLEQIMEIQARLKAKGFLPDGAAIDGVFGPITRRAISEWQRSTNTAVTEYASPTMLLRLQ